MLIITYANVHYRPRGDFYKMASNQALPGPSTSGFSSPSESPWEFQQKEKVISLCLARIPQFMQVSVVPVNRA